MSDSYKLLLNEITSLSPEVQAKLQPLLARYAALEQSFAETLEREKLASLKELAYGASHELNNPLANISTRAQALLAEETHPEKRRKLLTIVTQAMRAHEMISDLMLFAKPPQIQPESISLSEFLPQVMEQFQNSQPGSEVELQQTPFPATTTCFADKSQLATALHALLRNAAEAQQETGRIVIAVQLTPQATEISVQDYGFGIAPEVRRHIFDPFYSSREAGRGLGFGLSKCWRIMELHGGSITVESEVGAGATLTLHFPNNRHNS
jgi:signal transduction histidine kinase